MEILIQAKTQKVGNFQILFENYEGAGLFISEVLKQLQVKELQNLINNDSDAHLFEAITRHYNTQYQLLNDMVFYCDNENGVIYSDYCGKNCFEIERKRS